MKLELKHIAPYLPYGLNGICTQDYADIETVIGCCMDSRGNVELITNIDNVDVTAFKPVLQPLSCLAKEELEALVRVKHPLYEIINSLEVKHGGVWYKVTAKRMRYSMNGCEHFDALSIDQFNYLFSIHADVFGLIEKGLAVAAS